MRHDLAPEANRVDFVLGKVVGDTADDRVHFRATQFLVLGLLTGGHLHERGAGEINLRLLFDHHDVVAHAGHVRAAGGRASEDQADGRNLSFRTLSQMTKTCSTRNEYLILLWQVGASGFDAGNAR